MTQQPIPACDDEISLLDILVTLAESWKLLVFGSLVGGLLAGGLNFLWPKTFDSVAIVRLTEEEVALLHATPVLDHLIEKFGLLVDSGDNWGDVSDDLKKRLVFSTDKKTKLTRVTVKGDTPEAAQKLGQAAIDALLSELVPKGKQKEAIEQEIDLNNQIIANGIYFLERETSKRHAANAQISNLKLNNLELSFKLKPYGTDVYVQEPSLPQRKMSYKQLSLVFIVAVLSSGVALLMWVFVRKAWQQAAKESESAEKMRRIKAALGMKADS